jgi:hypothetical protein
MNTSISPQPKLLNYKNLNREKYEYLLPHKTQFGYYQSNCNYRLSKNQLLPFYIETPKLKTTSGIVKIDNKFYIDLEISQSGENSLFYDFLSKNDDNNISICHENSKEWFKQMMPLSVVENYYKTPIIKKSKGQLPVVRIRLPSYKGNILTEIFNIKKEKMNDINCIQSGDLLVGIIEYSGLMFMSQNFTPCYELHKIKLFKDNDIRLLSSGYMFSDMNDKVDFENNIKTDNILEDPTINDKNINDTDNLDMSILNMKTVKPIENTITKPNPNTNTSPILNDKKSLFDIIKESRFKDFMIDDELFKNNNKLFNKTNNDDSTKTIIINKKENKKENKKNKNIDNNYVNHTNDLMNILDNYDTADIENGFEQDLELENDEEENDEEENEENEENEEEYNEEEYNEEEYNEEEYNEYTSEHEGLKPSDEDLENEEDNEEDFAYTRELDTGFEKSRSQMKASKGSLEGMNPSSDNEEYNDYTMETSDEDIDYDTLNDLEVIVFDE